MKKSIVFFVLVIAVLLTSCPHKSQPQPNVPATGQTNGQGNGQGNDQGTQPAGPGTTEPGTNTPGTTEPGTTEPEPGTTEPESTPETYTLTFNKGSINATGTMEAQTFTKGVSQAITGNAFTYKNHVFYGWSTTAHGGRVYDNGATITLESDLTLYAVWRAEKGYTLASSVSLSQNMAYREKDETVQLTATVLPDDAADKTVTWSSSDESVATVDDAGLVTVVSSEVGMSTTITATTVTGKTATCVVTVTQVPVATKIGETDWVNISTGSLRLGKEANYHVTLTRSYDICNHEVTEDEFASVFADYTKTSTEANIALDKVNWYAAIAYCNKLSIQEERTPCYSVKVGDKEVDWANLKYDDIPTQNNGTWNAVTCNWDANGYRLPTEAEWEMAARGGRIGDVWSGSDYDELGNHAWHYNNTSETMQVKTKLSNEYGLYDMSGNVWEWVWDVRTNTYESEAINPTGIGSGTRHAQCGGSFVDFEDDFRCLKVHYRSSAEAYESQWPLGFRIVRTAK